MDLYPSVVVSNGQIASYGQGFVAASVRLPLIRVFEKDAYGLNHYRGFKLPIIQIVA